jgi:hypothetical protein
MPGGANKVEYAGFAPNAATVVYTFVGQRAAFARVSFLSFCNTDSVARTVTLAIVTAGGTITDAQYRLLDALSLDSKEALWLIEDGEDTGPILRVGDQLVIFASAANVVAARVCVEEFQQ